MADRTLPVQARAALEVSRDGDGDVVITVVVEAPSGSERRSLVVSAQDVPTLIDLLRRQMDPPDPEDLSTLRKLRPVT